MIKKQTFNAFVEVRLGMDTTIGTNGFDCWEQYPIDINVTDILNTVNNIPEDVKVEHLTMWNREGTGLVQYIPQQLISDIIYRVKKGYNKKHGKHVEVNVNSVVQMIMQYCWMVERSLIIRSAYGCDK